MKRSVRIAVVGVGHHGQHHVRILSEMKGVSLVGVADINDKRASEVAVQYGIKSFLDIREIFDHVDAVVVAVPTSAHVEVALPFLEHGVDVLVEKPITASLLEADQLLSASKDLDVLLGVGHTERFNPAIAVASPLIIKPRFVEVHRLGVFQERSLDINVIYDLMIHDLDVLLALVSSEVVSVEAVGVAVLSKNTDIANARIRFNSGCIANVTASRISRDRVRKIRFFQEDSYVSIDYAAQQVEAYTVLPKEGRSVIKGGSLDTKNEEPLVRELRDFVEAVQMRRSPLVSGLSGRNALDLATKIEEKMTVG